jgi:two-component system, chemotaxis family, chemotaxis protein CheY
MQHVASSPCAARARAGGANKIDQVRAVFSPKSFTPPVISTMRALVIDDSRALRRILCDMLRQLGFDVVDAGNGLEGLQRLTENGTPDVVLLDWNMPEMNGYEFLCAVRKKNEYDKMPIMMVTTETEAEQITTALAAGANEYVMKPFSKEVMSEKLQLLGLGLMAASA